MIFSNNKIRKFCQNLVNAFGGLEAFKKEDTEFFKLIKAGIVKVKPNGSISFNVGKWLETPEGKQKFKRIMQSMPKV